MLHRALQGRTLLHDEPFGIAAGELLDVRGHNQHVQLTGSDNWEISLPRLLLLLLLLLYFKSEFVFIFQ